MKRYIIMIMLFILVIILGFIFLHNSQTIQNQKTSLPSILQTPKSTSINISASFTIITDNITRSFKAEKYHNQSKDVYIEASNPEIVHVTKLGVTWDDFFKTLPMKLTEDCLTTGDGENLCNTSGSLKFYLNEIETSNLLDQEIKQGDKILIKYTSTSN